MKRNRIYHALAYCAWVGLLLLSASQASDSEWLLKTPSWKLTKSSYAISLRAKGFDPDVPLPPAQQQKFLEELYIRTTLAHQALQSGVANDPLIEQKIAEFRQDLLASQQLERQIESGMPDFSERVKELYQAKLATDYTLPLRLRVRVIRLQVTTEDSRVQATERLQTLRSELMQNKLSFIEAVERYSEAPDKTLTQGDSQWFHQSQVSPVFYEAALQLTAKQPLSEVVSDKQALYLLQYLDRKDSEIIPFDVAKAALTQTLKDDYHKQQQRSILEGLRQQFKQDAVLNTEP